MTDRPARSNPFADGPYLSCAVLCERVLIEADGTYSAIRIIDTVTSRQVGPNAAPEMAPFRQNLTLLVIFRSGQARGRATLRIRTIYPSGIAGLESSSAMHFRGEEIGHFVPVRMNLVLEYEGVYWFEVLVDDVLATKVPLRVLYRPEPNP
jgi:hypothetical protein